MKRSLATIAIVMLASGAPNEGAAQRVDPPPVPREFRAAWVTPVSDLGLRDWPSKPGLSAAEQRAEFVALADRAAAAGLNAIILHVRIAADAMYPTRNAPWSAFLTGASGVAPEPSYDPLAFAIAEAHERGLQLHAWFNPFRAMSPLFAGKAASTHVTRAHPEWIRRYGTQTWMDPGIPAARRASLDAILDVVRRYDVDGIHVDDYFYPYRETRTVTRRVKGKRVRSRVEIPFPDAASWKQYGVARGWTDRDAWRRSNIDQFVQALYRETKAIKPAVLVGVSPFGIWRPGSPPGITGLDAYREIYADARRWLGEGWLDYLAPQLYWPLDGVQNRFRRLDDWWRGQNPQGRHIWPGLYTSRIIAPRQSWSMGEIPAQISTLRNGRAGSTDANGHVHFRISALFRDGDALARRLVDTLYADRAVVPEAPWIPGAVPAAPSVTSAATDGPPELTVAPGDTVPVRWWLVQTRDRSGQWRTVLRPARSGVMSSSVFGTEEPSTIAISAISFAGRASKPTIVTP